MSYAYVGFSAEFAVLDIANPAQPRRIGYLPIYASKIATQGEYTYVGGRQGLNIVAIKAPTHPIAIGFIATEAVTGLTVASDHVYIVDQDGGLAILDGLQIVDISNPAQIHRIGAINTPGFAQAVAVAGCPTRQATYSGRHAHENLCEHWGQSDNERNFACAYKLTISEPAVSFSQ